MLTLRATGPEGLKEPLVGALRSTLMETWYMEAVVDAWPRFTHVLLRPDARRMKSLEFTTSRHYLHSWSYDKLYDFMVTPGVVDWDQEAVFVAVPPVAVEPLQRASAHHGGTSSFIGTDWYINIASPEALEQGQKKYSSIIQSLPAGFTLGSLQPHHAKVIVDEWIYMRDEPQHVKDNNARLLLHLIARHHSSCVYNPGGRPVSWAILKVDSSGGMAHTLEEYRGQGIYPVVHADYMQKAHQAREPVFGFTALDNAPALRVLHGKFGGRGASTVKFLTHHPATAAAKL